jgi:tRNA dimethylallyltransferase
MLPDVIFLMGPTAVGKTDLAIALADRLPVEIISVDSAMIYRGMDIGTGKPKKALAAGVAHHLIDIRDPTEPYSVAEFCSDAQECIQSIIKKGKVPLLVGGTMLYFKALRDGIAILPSAKADVRKQLTEKAKELGLSELHAQLSIIDPAAAKRIHPNDAQRLLRALEVYTVTGKNLSHHFSIEKKQHFPYTLKQVAIISSDRQYLHQRISDRFKAMLAWGLLEEVRELQSQYELNTALPAMRAVGYRQVWQFFNGELSYDTMIEHALAATRQLAKRQLTWLRSWEGLTGFDVMTENLLESLVESMTNNA